MSNASAVVAKGAAARRSVSARSVTLGLALIPPNVIWVVLMEKVDGRAFSTTISLFFTAVFSLLLVVAANALVRRLRPALALNQGELLTIFSLLSIGTAIAGLDFGQVLVCMMPHGFWFATPENGWQSTIWQYLPRWLTVQDPAALRGYYLGNATLYDWTVLRAWLAPVGWWTLFVGALLWVMACLNTVIRSQWTERERLAYPVVQLPLAMTSDSGSLYRARLFWLGFTVAAALNAVNGLHNLIPSVPTMTFNGYDAGQWFIGRPWDAMGWTPLSVFPFIVGLGYLLPVDLLFSCWFFFLFWRAEKIVSSALGHATENPRAPYIDEQMLGAYMAVGAFALWAARDHLRGVWRTAVARGRHASGPDDPMGFRTAVFGGIAGFVFLVAFSAAAGMPVWIGVAFFLLYFAIALAVTRMRAELGPPTHDLHFIGPYQSLYTAFGSRMLGGPALGVMTLFYWFNRAYRCHPMPHHLESMRLGQSSGVSARSMLPALGAAALVGWIATFWASLHVSYQLGAAARIHGWGSLGYGSEAYARLNTWVSNATTPDSAGLWGMLVGFLSATGLMLVRMNVYGWPFHALGFAISGGWSMMWAWMSLFVAWGLKVTILRYRGLKGYRDGLPFFFGVILGDFLVGGIWTLLGLLFDMPIHSLWSG